MPPTGLKPWPGRTPRLDVTLGAVLLQLPGSHGRTTYLHGGSGPGPSCRPSAHRIQRRNAGEIQMWRSLRLGQRDSARARRRLRLARLAGTCSAASAAVDEQAVDGIRHAVQGRTYGRQAAEPLPPFLILKADLEHHAPVVRMPRPVDSAVRQRRLDQCRVVLLLPPESRELSVQDLDRPPFNHCGDSTSFSWIRNGRK